MARWEIALQLQRDGRTPVYRQIARSIVDDIRRGRLRPGDPLPGARTLARTLGVQRMTVVAAFDDLAAEGWIVSEERRGTFVSPEMPPSLRADRRAVTRIGAPNRLIVDLPPAPPANMPYDVSKGMILFAPNRADVRLVPRDLIARAYRRSLRQHGEILLTYGRPQGHERLREAIATMVSASRGVAATADDICVTRGSQMAFDLLCRALIRPGDVIAVEELTYRPAVEVFRIHGAEVVPVPLDDEGLRTDALEQLARDGRLRAAYVSPHHQFPTTVTLQASRRMRLLELARQYRFVIIEEDYDHEFHYDGSPVLPLASVDDSGVVAYVGTLSKVLAPALRIGWIVAPRPLIRSVTAHRLYIDAQGDRVLEHALAELMEEGEVQRHIRRARREYEARRDIMAGALKRTFGEELVFTVPAGGIGLWVHTATFDVERWAVSAQAQGAVIATAKRFAVNGRPRPYARLGFASLERHEILEGVRRLGRARRDLA